MSTALAEVVDDDQHDRDPVVRPDRRELRVLLGGAAILSVSEAAAWLPIGDHRARRWFREAGLIRRLDGKEVVIWSDVLAAVRGGGLDVVQQEERPGRRKVAGVDMSEVDDWIRRKR